MRNIKLIKKNWLVSQELVLFKRVVKENNRYTNLLVSDEQDWF